jgi:hypothetical protein
MAGDSSIHGNGLFMVKNADNNIGNTLEKTDTVLTIGKLKLRGKTDDLPQYVPPPLHICLSIVVANASLKRLVVRIHSHSPPRRHHWPSRKRPFHCGSGHKMEDHSAKQWAIA